MKERTSAGKLHQKYQLYLNEEGMHHFAINSVLFLTAIREKYVNRYKRFIEELKRYSGSYMNPFQRLSAYYLLPPSKLKEF